MADICCIGRELEYTKETISIPRISADIKVNKLCKRLNRLELDTDCIKLIKRMIYVCDTSNKDSGVISVNIYLAIKENGNAYFISKKDNYYLSSTYEDLFIHRVSRVFDIMQELPRIISEETKIIEYRLDFVSEWYCNIIRQMHIENKELYNIANNKTADKKMFNLSKINSTSIKKFKANVNNYKYYGKTELYYITLKNNTSTYFYSEDNKTRLTESISSITLFTNLKMVNKEARNLIGLANDLVVRIMTLIIN